MSGRILDYLEDKNQSYIWVFFTPGYLQVRQPSCWRAFENICSQNCHFFLRFSSLCFAKQIEFYKNAVKKLPNLVLAIGVGRVFQRARSNSTKKSLLIKKLVKFFYKISFDEFQPKKKEIHLCFGFIEFSLCISVLNFFQMHTRPFWTKKVKKKMTWKFRLPFIKISEA